MKSSLTLNKPARLLRPLTKGTPVCHWKLSSIEAHQYDVADAPMSGEMDAQFFLTKEKNFIPHEYPCRTEFAAKFRNKHPEPVEPRPMTQIWLPFGSPRVDLSGFWFRATRVNAWAETSLSVASAGIAKFRLSCCGGAIIWLNGVEAGSMSVYQRNYETEIEFSAELKQGLNDIRVYFDDLAERDTRYFFQLTYVDGPEAEVALPVACDASIADEMEKLLNTMHFDRPAYSQGHVTLLCPVTVHADLDVKVTVKGDFLAQEKDYVTRVLKSGQNELDLGPIETFHSDFRHFDVQLSVADHAVSRPFTVEVAHCDKQGEAPATLEARVQEALDYVSENGYGDSVAALARLANGLGDETTQKMIDHSLPRIEQCYDCADFHLVPLLFGRIRYGRLLPKEMLERIDAATLGFRYWMDEPGNDVQWYFSENHSLLFHTCAYLAGHFHADKTFVRSGRTGAEQSKAGATRLRAWFDHFEQWEMAEFNSVPYFPIDLKGLTTLYALAHDTDIRERAGKAIVRLISVVAASAHQGILTGAQGRSYEHTLMTARTSELSAISRVLWSRGWYGRCFETLPQLLICIKEDGLEVPEELKDIARLGEGKSREWMFSQGKDQFAHLYHYKTADTAMGSLARYRWNEWGYQETILQLRLGTNPDSQIWVNHPGEVIHCGFGRPSYWGGCGSIPRAHQYKNLGVAIFEIHETQPDFSHIWFPRKVFDETLITDTQLSAASGNGLVTVLGESPMIPVELGPTAGDEVRQNGRHAVWIFRLGQKDRAGSLKAFADEMAVLKLVTSETGSVTINDPEYGTVVFDETGDIHAEGRDLRPAEWSISGHVCE